MRHEEIKASLGLYAAGALSDPEAAAVREHLASGCQECLRAMFTQPVARPPVPTSEPVRFLPPPRGRRAAPRRRCRVIGAVLVILALAIGAAAAWTIAERRQQPAVPPTTADTSASALKALERERAALTEQLATAEAARAEAVRGRMEAERAQVTAETARAEALAVRAAAEEALRQASAARDEPTAALAAAERERDAAMDRVAERDQSLRELTEKYARATAALEAAEARVAELERAATERAATAKAVPPPVAPRTAPAPGGAPSGDVDDDATGEELSAVETLAAAPGVRRLDLEPAEPDSGVRGHVLWHAARDLLALYVFDLPALEDGERYRAIMRLDDGRVVNGPSVRPGAGGRAAIPVPLGVPGARLRRLDVVREPGTSIVLTGQLVTAP